MIVKLSNPGGVIRYIEADQVFQQPVRDNRIDLEITREGHPSQRFIIADSRFPVPDSWERAYIMERGKTVDAIRAWAMPRP